MRISPGTVGPIFSRSPNESLNKVDQRFKKLAALELTSEERESLDSWTVTMFCSATLRRNPKAGEIEDHGGSKTPAAPASSASLPGPRLDFADAPPAVVQLTRAIRLALDVARAEGKNACLTPDVLVRLNGNDIGTREPDRISVSTGADPGLMVYHACQWFATASFDELNPIEQAAIVLLRLLTIRPFEERNEQTALVASSLFTLRAGLPPVVIMPEAQPAFDAALQDAAKMNTQPTVELIANSITVMLDGTIDFVSELRGKQGRRG